MKFDVEKLKAIAQPLPTEEKTALEYLSENAEWLRLSATIALKIRKILRQKGLSQADLAALLSVTPAQVSKLLSGKINFELKTIANLQSALGETILEINLSDKPVVSAEQHISAQVVVVTQFVKSNPIVSNQRIGQQTYFSGYNILG